MFKFIKKLRELSYYGFPIMGEKKETKSTRGVAIMIALLTIMLMVGMVTDLIITSSVNIEMAVASRDRIRSEYLAKSGFNFGLYFLMISWGMDVYRAGAQPPVKKELSDDGESVWNAVNKLPPLGSMMVQLLKGPKKEDKNDEDDDDEDDEDDPFKLRGVMSEGIMKTMELFEESFSVRVLDESSKINLNSCYEGRCLETIQMLTALFSCPPEKAFLDSKKLEPEQMAYRIKDFISNATTTSPESGFNDKNTPYQAYTPAYNVKGTPFDSIDELKLVEGWDDDMHTVFAPYLTVYPYPSGGTGSSSFRPVLNINSVRPELLSCLIPEAQSQACAQKFAQRMYKLKKDNTTVLKNSVKETLSDLACMGSQTTTSEGGQKDPASWFDKKSGAFSIEVDANTGKQYRKLVAVVKRLMPGTKTAPSDQTPVKRSYQILHWKMD